MVYGGANYDRKVISLRMPFRNDMGDGMTEKGGVAVVKTHAKKVEMPKLAPHDLRRSCARFCHAAGGELEQIQFLLGHVSVQTTERYYVQHI
jgi:site-specific recombinase XerD